MPKEDDTDKAAEDSAAEEEAAAEKKAAIMKAIESPLPIEWVPPQKLQARDAIKRVRQVAFLEAFSKCGNVGTSCKAAGVNLNTERHWRNSPDIWYKENFRNAVQAYGDFIRQTVHDRAVDGVEVPVFGKKYNEKFGVMEDTIVGTRRQHSDLLLMFHAKKIDHTYREHVQPQDDDHAMETVTPISRIAAKLSSIRERQTIDITPQTALPEKTVTEDPDGQTTDD